MRPNDLKKPTAAAELLSPAAGTPTAAGSPTAGAAAPTPTPRDELAETRAFRELVIGILSHDLRNPLAAISGLTQLVLRKEGLPADVVRRLFAIDGATKRINELIETLLDFGKLQVTGELELAPTSVDLGELCARVIAERRLTHPHGRLVFEPSGSVRGTWDPVKLAQLLAYLLANAVA